MFLVTAASQVYNNNNNNKPYLDIDQSRKHLRCKLCKQLQRVVRLGRQWDIASHQYNFIYVRVWIIIIIIVIIIIIRCKWVGKNCISTCSSARQALCELEVPFGSFSCYISNDVMVVKMFSYPPNAIQNRVHCTNACIMTPPCVDFGWINATNTCYLYSSNRQSVNATQITPFVGAEWCARNQIYV